MDALSPTPPMATPDAAQSRIGLEFYEEMAPIADFRSLGDPANYKSLPDDWIVGVADIENSTLAIAEGHYKTVNTVAAAVIAALCNAVPQRDFPFVFGGDGVGFCLPGDLAEKASNVLRGVARWSLQANGLRLRVALSPVREVRRSGFDVTVARHAPSPDVSYAMFGGGGLTDTERRMKHGDLALAPADASTPHPDLDGLLCRFAPLTAQRGVILSMVVLLEQRSERERFYELTRDLLTISQDDADAGNPVPPTGAATPWPSPGAEIEASVVAETRQVSLQRARLRVYGKSLAARLGSLTGVGAGNEHRKRIGRELAPNTDFRKFADGLRMTLDCTPELAHRLEARLRTAYERGIASYGVHRQDKALITCFVPSMTRSDHVHFVDGADGGYARAMAAATRQRAEAA